jgi:hypothetical protein
MGSSTRAGAGWADGRMNGTEKLQLILNCMHVRISHLASRPHPRWQWRAWVPTGKVARCSAPPTLLSPAAAGHGVVVALEILRGRDKRGNPRTD